ncbi:MAG: glycosyl transferase [Phycisphaeraceae bacterium]|nr:glycosyl transferase [Phycisphaeraceae bacterium]
MIGLMASGPLHVLIVAAGSVGDVYPCVGIGCALRRRGHRVTVIANPWYERLVRRAGLDFAPVGTAEAQQEMLSHPRAWHPRSGWKVWMRMAARAPMREVYGAIEDRYERGRTVVAASWAGLGARIAQERLGVPLVSLHLEPDKLRSVHRSSVMPAPLVMADFVPKLAKRWQYWLVDVAVVDRVLAPRLNRFRAELGLRPVRRVIDAWWHSPQRIVGLFPSWWGPVQPDWPDQVRLAGFPFWDDDEAPAAGEIEQFLADGPPPVVFTPGAVNRDAGGFFRAAVEACRIVGCRGLMLTRSADQLPRDLPTGVRHFEYLRFSEMLPRVAAVVHHAGIGTAAQCLRAGVPQLVTPFMHFHRDTARRLRRLGVGREIGPGRIKGRVMADRLGSLLASDGVRNRCRDFAGQCDGGGIERACSLIEDLAGRDGEESSI